MSRVCSIFYAKENEIWSYIPNYFILFSFQKKHLNTQLEHQTHQTEPTNESTTKLTAAVQSEIIAKKELLLKWKKLKTLVMPRIGLFPTRGPTLSPSCILTIYYVPLHPWREPS